MRTQFYFWRKVTIFLVVFGIIVWLRAPEIVIVRAIDIVPLFDPSSLSGSITTIPKVVGELKSGETLTIKECVDTKSDINFHALYKGQIVTIGEWKAKIDLLRHHAYPWEKNATTSCLGLF